MSYTLDRALEEVGARRWAWKIPGRYTRRDGTTVARPDDSIIKIAEYDPAPIRGLNPPPRDSTTRIPIAIGLSSGSYAWCDVVFNDLLKLKGLVRPEELHLFAIMLESHAQHFVIDLDGDADVWPQLLGKEVEIEAELRALFCEFYQTQFGAAPDMSAWRADSVPAPASGAPTKTSIHVNHPGVAFKTQRDLREFVLRFVRWIVTTRADSILVNRDAGCLQRHFGPGGMARVEDFDKATPVDVKVYNKDRNMRLSYSRKPGVGKLPLLPMDPNTTLEDALWSSLVCYSMPADPAEWLSYNDHYECVALEPGSRKRRAVEASLPNRSAWKGWTATWSEASLLVASAETGFPAGGAVDYANFKGTFAELPPKEADAVLDSKSAKTESVITGQEDERADDGALATFMCHLPPAKAADLKLIVSSLSRERRLFGVHDAWRDVVWAIKAVCNNEPGTGAAIMAEGYAIAAEWTKIWEDAAQRNSVLEKTWQSGRTDRFNIGSLWRWAKEDMEPAAYKALWKQINPPAVMNAAKRAAAAAAAEKALPGDDKNGDAAFNIPLATAPAVNVFDMSIPENFAFMRKTFNTLSTSMSEDMLCCYFQRAGLSPEQIVMIRRDHRLTAEWEWSQDQELREEAETATLRVTQREVLDMLFSRLPAEFMTTNSLCLKSDEAAIICRRDLGMAEVFKARYHGRMIFKASGAECYVWNPNKALYDELTPDFVYDVIAAELIGVVERAVAQNEWQQQHHAERWDVLPGSPEDQRWQTWMTKVEAGKVKLEKAEAADNNNNKRTRKRRKTEQAQSTPEVAVKDNEPDMSDPDILAALQAGRTADRFKAMWTNKLFVLRTLQLKLCEKTSIVCSTVIQQIKKSMRDETIDERMNVSVPWEIPIMDGLVLNCKDKTVRRRTMQDFYTDIFPVRYRRPDSKDPADVVGFEMSHKYLRGLAREGSGMTDGELKSLEVDDKAEYERLVRERDERLEVLCSRAGYTLLGEHIVKELEVFHGPSGNNGKTLFSKLMDAIMGPTFCYAPETSALFSVEKDTGKQTSWKMPLRHARCALIAEPPRGLAINDTFVKIVAGGGDKQKAREVFGRQKDSRSFISPTTWWVFSNFPLKIRDDDKFSRKRANVIPALAQFAEDDVEGQRFVKDILDKYKDYVFSTFVEYAHRFYTDEATMGVTLPPPGKSVVEYKNKVMSGNEPWLCFLRCCEVSKDAEITSRQFWENWESWKQTQKMFEKIALSDKDVKERFEAHCGEPRKAASREDRASKAVGAKRSLFYYGIGPLLKDWQQVAKGGPW